MEEKFYKPRILCSGRISFENEGQMEIKKKRRIQKWKEFITKQSALQETSKEALSAIGNDTKWKPGLV